MLNKENLNTLYRYAISLCKNEDQAYDLLQSSIEKGLKNNVSSKEKPMAYLKTIIRHQFFDLERRRKVVPIVSIESDDYVETEEVTKFTLEELMIQENEVSLLLDNLTPVESELLFLSAVEEYTADEIAKMQQLPRGTVLSRLHRLKKRLQIHCQNEPELIMQVQA